MSKLKSKKRESDQLRAKQSAELGSDSDNEGIDSREEVKNEVKPAMFEDDGMTDAERRFK